MQSSIKSFFGKTVNTSKASISAANKSPSKPVQLVSYSITNSPLPASRPLKRKTPDADHNKRLATKRLYDTTKRVRRFLPHWKYSYPWLEYDSINDKMWCNVCREYYNSLNNNKRKKHSSNNFIHGSDFYKIDTVRDHNSSECHTLCMENKASKMNPHDRPLAVGCRNMNADQREKYTILFNTAFTVAKCNYSFRQFENLCRLQNKNKVNIGSNYQNHASCRRFVASIADVQRQEAAVSISKSRFIAVMADGSTDRSVAEQESVYIRFVCNGEPTNRFIALVELTSGTAGGVLNAIDTALNLVGVGIEDQKSKLVNINLDGASVNMGIYSGVAAQLQERLGPHITKIHCINHQLELAIVDVRKDSAYLVIFESTLKVSLIIY